MREILVVKNQQWLLIGVSVQWSHIILFNLYEFREIGSARDNIDRKEGGKEGEREGRKESGREGKKEMVILPFRLLSIFRVTSR